MIISTHSIATVIRPSSVIRPTLYTVLARLNQLMANYLQSLSPCTFYLFLDSTTIIITSSSHCNETFVHRLIGLDSNPMEANSPLDAWNGDQSRFWNNSTVKCHGEPDDATLPFGHFANSPLNFAIDDIRGVSLFPRTRNGHLVLSRAEQSAILLFFSFIFLVGFRTDRDLDRG